MNYFTTKTTNLNHTHTQKFGGFITYAKLIFSAFSNPTFCMLTPYIKARTFIAFIIIGFFKSFLSPFEVVEKLRGIFVETNTKIDVSRLNKSTTIKFLFLPIWHWERRATVEDLIKRKILNEKIHS